MNYTMADALAEMVHRLSLKTSLENEIADLERITAQVERLRKLNEQTAANLNEAARRLELMADEDKPR